MTQLNVEFVLLFTVKSYKFYAEIQLSTYLALINQTTAHGSCTFGNKVATIYATGTCC